MELRARLLGTSINAEYVQAVDELVGTATEWIELKLAQADIVDWLDQSEIVNAQMSPILVSWARVGPRAAGVTLMGRVLTVERSWFVTDEAFHRACNAVAASGAELLASSTNATWSGQPVGHGTSVTFGWRGVPGRNRRSRLPPDLLPDDELPSPAE